MDCFLKKAMYASFSLKAKVLRFLFYWHLAYTGIISEPEIKRKHT